MQYDSRQGLAFIGQHNIEVDVLIYGTRKAGKWD
jgi:hypothetical protein